MPRIPSVRFGTEGVATLLKDLLSLAHVCSPTAQLNCKMLISDSNIRFLALRQQYYRRERVNLRRTRYLKDCQFFLRGSEARGTESFGVRFRETARLTWLLIEVYKAASRAEIPDQVAVPQVLNVGDRYRDRTFGEAISNEAGT